MLSNQIGECEIVKWDSSDVCVCVRVLREFQCSSVASPNQPSWSFSTCQHSAHFVLPMKVPVRLITSALHKCSLNATRQQWDLLWLILICGGGRHIWMTLMGSWVTACSFFCHFVLSQGERNICQRLFTPIPVGFLWPLFSWRRRTCTAEPVTAPFELRTVLYYNVTLGSTCGVKVCGLNKSQTSFLCSLTLRCVSQ